MSALYSVSKSINTVTWIWRFFSGKNYDTTFKLREYEKFFAVLDKHKQVSLRWFLINNHRNFSPLMLLFEKVLNSVVTRSFFSPPKILSIMTHPVIDGTDSTIKTKCFNVFVDKPGLSTSSIAMITGLVRFWWLLWCGNPVFYWFLTTFCLFNFLSIWRRYCSLILKHKP